MAFPPVPFQEWFLRQTSTGNAALNAYVARVKADGGVVEAIGCVPLAVWDWVAPVAPSFVGLLDLFPNAAAAYSLRKLRAAYSGAAVRVRESGGNTEADIGFTSAGELDTAALLAHCGANDGFVTTWYDQSLSNDATQTTAANQPKIVSAGSLVVSSNGKPKISPDGTDDFLEINNTGLSIPNNSLIYIVGEYANSSDNVYFSTVDSTNYDNCLSIGSNFQGVNSGILSVRLGGVTGTRGALNQSKTGYNNGDVILTNTLLSSAFASSDSLFNNNTPDGSVGHRANISDPGAFLFMSVNAYYGDGPLQEVIFYDGSVSNQVVNRASIQTNINTFYSIY